MMMAGGFNPKEALCLNAASRMEQATSNVSSAIRVPPNKSVRRVRRERRAVLGPMPIETHGEDARRVWRLASRAVGDLMPARGAVSHDERLSARFAHGREQRQLAHHHRDPVGIGAIAKGAGHAAATRFDRLHLKAGNEPQRLLDLLERAE